MLCPFLVVALAGCAKSSSASALQMTPQCLEETGVDGTQPEPPPLLDVTAHTLRNFKAEEAFQSLSSNSTQYPSKLGKSGTVNAIFRRQS